MGRSRPNRIRGALVTVGVIVGGLLTGPAAAQGGAFISGYVGGVQEGECIGQVGACQVALHNWHGDVTVSVWDSPAKYVLLHRETVTVDGFASLDGGGNQPGNLVEATDGSTTVAMELPTHSAQIDAEHDVVSGISDPRGSIFVAVIDRESFAAGTPRNVVDCEVPIAPDGSWEIDLGAGTGACQPARFDFGPGDWVQVALNNVAAGGDVQTTAVVDSAFAGSRATRRIGSNTPVATAIAVSQERFQAAARGYVGEASHAVLSRDDVFADALAGTPLVGEGPLLLTPSDRLLPAVQAEIDRVLGDVGRVYLLGGTAALSQSIEDQLRAMGYEVVRLSGADRIATAADIAEEVRRLYPASAGTRLLARGFGTPDNPTAAWADSVTGGGFAAAARTPLLLSHTDHLSEAARAGIAGASRVILLGGTAALSAQVEAQAGETVGSVDRAAGRDRAETAVKIVTDVWRLAAGQGRFTILNAYTDAGWAFGLPAAGIAADEEAPLLPVAVDSTPPATADALRSCGGKRIETVVIGGSAVISDAVLAQIEALDGSC